MAIDMCSESSSLNKSPRISFSDDLHPKNTSLVEDYPHRSDSSLLDSNSDFDFCITSDGIDHEPSSADELFSDGLIRPLQLQQKFVNSKHVSVSNPQPIIASLSTSESSNQESSKQIISISSIESEQKPQSKSFWRIKRSSSLHCDNAYKKGSFWSLPLLSRSNSTGSVPKDNLKQNPQKQPKNSMAISSSSSSSSSSFYLYPLSQKAQLKMNYGGAYGNGVGISPVLNMPPPFISKGAANLLGLGALFRSGKDKKIKK